MIPLDSIKINSFQAADKGVKGNHLMAHEASSQKVLHVKSYMKDIPFPK